MPLRRAIAAVGLILTLTVAGAVAGHRLGDQRTTDRRASTAAVQAEPASAVRTTLPGLRPATGDPGLPSLSRLHPQGVIQAPGPFDDRLVWDGLRFDGRQVTGMVQVRSDVSDILELEVVSGFYDRSGRLLGTGRSVYHLVEDGPQAQRSGAPHEARRFAIAVPARWRGTSVGAAAGVAVLVNE